MKTNWQTKKLGEVCDIKTGKKDVNEGNPDGKYPFFTCAREHTFSDSYSFDAEAILIAGNGDVGNVDYYNGKFEAYQRTYILSNFRGILAPFLFRILDGTLKDTVSKQKLGNTMPYIKMGMLFDFEIPLPSISEQKRIVKILDEVFEKVAKAKENAEKNLQNAKEFFESYLQSVFANPGKNWKENNLGELCEVITKGTTPTSMGYKFVEKGINFIKIESITPDGKFLPNKFAAITEECYKAFKRSQLKKGDILFSIAGALGRTAFVDEDILPANTNQALAIVRLKLANNVLPKFILLSLNSGLTFGQISKFKGGVAQQNLSLEQLKNFQISLPLPSEQKAIVKKLDALSAETKKLEAIYKQKLADLEELKKSVLKKAFSGEL